MSLLEKQKKIILNFKLISNWEERYKKIINFGKKLPLLEDQHKIQMNKISGCQSQVWMVAYMAKNGKIIYKADSDALIVRGLIFLLLQVYSDSDLQEIIDSDAQFIKEIGLDRNLSISRANGLNSMIRKIKFYALSFRELKKIKT